MSLLYLAIWRSEPKPAHELASDASGMSAMNRIAQWGVLKVLNPIVEDMVKTLQKGARRRSVIEDHPYAAHAFQHPAGICAVIGSRVDYDQVAAQMVLNKVIDQFLEENPRSDWSTENKKLAVPKINGKSPLEVYADPTQINKMAAIQKDLDETMETMRKAIQQATLRGNELDLMVEKSDQLSSSSKMFYQQAKKQNSCCVLM